MKKKIDKEKVKGFGENIAVFGRSLVVGGITASITKTLVAPLERTKIILQTRGKEFNGMFDCLIKLWTRQPKDRSVFIKPLTYYRGNGANVMRYFPMQAITFAFKSQFKRLLQNDNEKEVSFMKDMIKKLFIGGAAGATGFTVVYPLELARTRLTSDISLSKRRYNGMIDCIKKTFKNERGFRSLYKGYGVSLVGMIPYRAVYFGGYDLAKKHIMKGKPENYNFFTKWAISQSVAISSQLISYPHDTVRRRIQIMGEEGGIVYKSATDCFLRIFREEGFTALFKGASANIFRSTGGAMCLVFFDTIGKFIFGDKNYGN